jgi:hypothetical protein
VDLVEETFITYAELPDVIVVITLLVGAARQPASGPGLGDCAHSCFTLRRGDTHAIIES